MKTEPAPDRIEAIRQLAGDLIDAIPGFLGMTPDPWPMDAEECKRPEAEKRGWIQSREAFIADVARFLDAALRTERDAPPKKCSCWIGRGEEGGWAPDRITCAVHGETALREKAEAERDALQQQVAEQDVDFKAVFKEMADRGAELTRLRAALQQLQNTLCGIVAEGKEQPTGRLLWRLQLCVEQLKLLAGDADASVTKLTDISPAALAAWRVVFWYRRQQCDMNPLEPGLGILIKALAKKLGEPPTDVSSRVDADATTTEELL